MRQDLLLARYTGRVARAHDGKVITLRSNLRWCSDAFEVRCWSGECVQVAFAKDCCDREVMSYVATTAAITGEMARDLMAESLEQRSGPEARRGYRCTEVRFDLRHWLTNVHTTTIPPSPSSMHWPTAPTGGGIT